MRGNLQLVRIGAAFRSDRDHLSTPSQFCAASVKSTPAPDSVLSWIAVSSAIPTLHGLHGDSVSDSESSAVNCRSQRRIATDHDLRIAGDCHLALFQLLLKLRHVFHGAQAKNLSAHGSVFSLFRFWVL